MQRLAVQAIPREGERDPLVLRITLFDGLAPAGSARYVARMLLRRENGSVLLISQPAHAWVTGQMARQWGNEQFATLTEEVCLAAEQHDIGFSGWEEAPTWDPATGLPHSFLDLPARTHLEVWTHSVRMMLQFGRFPALLVSMHFTSLARRALIERTGKERETTASFLEAQTRLQNAMAKSLRADPHYASRSSDEQLRDDQQIVSLLDWISLQVLLNFQEERIGREASLRPGAAAFELTPLSPAGDRVRLRPWPFRSGKVELVCDARRLDHSRANEAEMRAALQAAPRESLAIRLEPA